YVTLVGKRGTGTAIVPVNSFATGRLGMSPALGTVLLALGIILTIALITIVRAAAADSLVPAGEQVDAARTRRANLITAASLPVIALLVFGGASWWQSVDSDYQRTMFRPPAAIVSVRDVGGRRELAIALRDTAAFHA